MSRTLTSARTPWKPSYIENTNLWGKFNKFGIHKIFNYLYVVVIWKISLLGEQKSITEIPERAAPPKKSSSIFSMEFCCCFWKTKTIIQRKYCLKSSLRLVWWLAREPKTKYLLKYIILWFYNGLNMIFGCRETNKGLLLNNSRIKQSYSQILLARYTKIIESIQNWILITK